MSEGEETESRYRQIRKIVSGNPSLGTYEGCVHIRTCNEYDDSDIYSDSDSDDTISDKDEYRRMVSICNVPPEQVPEGVLNLARSYRHSIKHVRVLISEPETPQVQAEEIDRKLPSHHHVARTKDEHISNFDSASYFQQRPLSSFMEDAAGIITDDQTNILRSRDESSEYDNINGNDDDDYYGDNEDCKLKYNGTYYMVLMLLESSEVAKSFVQNLHRKPFNNFEKDTLAAVYHVSKLEGEMVFALNPNVNRDQQQQTSSPRHRRRNRSLSVSSASSPFKQRSTITATNEENNCPVCLDPMELNIDDAPSLFTTVCNHTFHLNCLLQWEDAPCPVCRFDHAGINDTLAQCHVCGSTENIYVCLICGVASCSNAVTSDAANNNTKGVGRGEIGVYGKNSSKSESCDSVNAFSTGGHAWEHYEETLHAYAVDTETQHVWDYVGQGFVHRLLQNEDDGKIVEVSDPTNTTNEERSLIPSLTDAEEGEVVHRKLEGYASEYNKLLKNQLGQQQIYFEGVLREIRYDHEVNANKSKKTGRSPSDLILALKQELNQLQQRQHTLGKKSNKVAENISFLKNMNESLEANKEPMEREICELQQARVEYSEMQKQHLPMLEERIRLLMVKLENDP